MLSVPKQNKTGRGSLYLIFKKKTVEMAGLELLLLLWLLFVEHVV